VLTQSRNAQTLAIVGDEMQCVSPDAYSYLIDVTNDLNEMGLRTITLSFGQPELNALRSVLKETHRGDILGRFLSRVFAFEGIGSEAELREVMLFYDDPAEFEYPQASGICFSEFFLPKAYASGWRLASCAASCWEGFRQHAVTRLSSPATVQKLSVGMQWITGALQFSLVNCTDLDAPDLKITSEDWDLAVQSSGFAESLGLTYDPDWETVQ
jgi:hypothetical protein